MVKYPQAHIRLFGEDGDAFAILGRVSQALRKIGVKEDERETFWKEATAGDYNHLLRTAQRWVSCDMDFYNGEYDYRDPSHYCGQCGEPKIDCECENNYCGWCGDLHEDCECEC